jgi:predicted  nucleic acid-binding Zn-ribbon protein
MIMSPTTTDGKEQAQESIAKTYVQLNQAEQAAARMESMLDKIELKMQQLEAMQSAPLSGDTVYEFQKLTVELDGLQRDVEAIEQSVPLEEE